MPLLLLVAVAVCLPALGWAEPKVVKEWTFDRDAEGWKAANHVSDMTVTEGALQATITNWDPFVVSPQFDIPVTAWQRIELRLKSDVGGGGEIYYTNTLDTQYAGFSPGKSVPFQVIGDGQWHDYVLYPFWQAEKKLILVRLDLPRPPAADYGKVGFALDYLRIVDLGTPPKSEGEGNWDFTRGLHGWAPMGQGTVAQAPGGARFSSEDGKGYLVSGPLSVPLVDNLWVSIEMAVDRGTAGQIRWASDDASGLQAARFPLRADGQMHRYNVDMSAYAEWRGNALMLGITPSSEPGATATIRSIAIAEEPQGGPDVTCTYIGPENAVNRVGKPAPLLVRLENHGGAPAGNLRLASSNLPATARLVGDPSAAGADAQKIPSVEPGEPLDWRVWVTSTEPTRVPVTLRLEGEGAPGQALQGSIAFTPALNLPPTDYVPVPQPVESDYEIGAFYFPGWSTPERWAPIRRNAPQRKPVLGYYDEANPECVDWQIKWAVEHGIKFFMVDWYWSAGGRHLEHWVQAFEKARYRSYLKWCMMWANHNAAGTHSEEDQRAVTRYWIEHCFNMPEYYKIDGRPVVIIWSPQNMRRDMADKGGAKRLLDISQEVAKEAGLKGIYFVGMKWPEAATDAAELARLKGEGFEMTSIYHYMHHGGKAVDPTRFSFDLVADSSYQHWMDWKNAFDLPFLPNLSTGWDARPWHGEKTTVISGRTVPLFKRICEDAKRFSDETGIKRLALAPLNEWGEGSYLEPCTEFGFEMYDVVRDTFCRKPEGGWPPNITPADVNRGPYDLPMAVTVRRTSWDFDGDAQGWGPMMGVTELRAEGGVLRFTTATTDPAVSVGLGGLRAKDFAQVVIRLKAQTPGASGDSLQLFWATTTAAASEGSSAKLPLIGDGEWHEYRFDVAKNPRWQGRLASFRLDPGSRPGVRVEIDSVVMEPVKP